MKRDFALKRTFAVKDLPLTDCPQWAIFWWREVLWWSCHWYRFATDIPTRIYELSKTLSKFQDELLQHIHTAALGYFERVIFPVRQIWLPAWIWSATYFEWQIIFSKHHFLLVKFHERCLDYDSCQNCGGFSMLKKWQLPTACPYFLLLLSNSAAFYHTRLSAVTHVFFATTVLWHEHSVIASLPIW